MLALIGQKKTQSQRFLENGRRIPVTLIDVKGNTVVSLKTNERDHYQAVQLGFSIKKKATRAEVGHAKGAKLEKAPKFLREVRVVDESESLPQIGDILNPVEVFTPGDIVDVSGFSKGKGFQGGVKRHGFHGGPKTHGQSDRHRAPGSIGQGTTPGRVYKGKRMAGNMGNENVTIQNLKVIDVTNDGVLVIKGLVPGIINGLIVVKKVGEDKKFVPLQKTPEQLAAEEEIRLAEEAAAKEAEEKVAKEADEEETVETKVEESVVDKTEAVEEAKVEGAEESKVEVEPAAEVVKTDEAKEDKEAASADLESASDEPKEVNEDGGK